MNWSILYRGSLSSCNYACTYCPFAKTKNTRQELAKDAKELARFVDWVEHQSIHNIGILFTPWGEGLIRKQYQKAIVHLSHLPHVRKVAIQTNLSCQLDWLKEGNKSKIALWTTYHPQEVSRKKFVQKCSILDQLGVSYSVGVVGFKDALNNLELLRNELPEHVYVWINAYKKDPDYYTEDEVVRLVNIDPLVRYNMVNHESLGLNCLAGESVFSVDGDGTMTRCHFIKHPIGNIYEKEFEKSLFLRPCTNLTCGCHIGYVHLEKLKLYDVFKDGVLERIPSK